MSERKLDGWEGWLAYLAARREENRRNLRRLENGPRVTGDPKRKLVGRHD